MNFRLATKDASGEELNPQAGLLESSVIEIGEKGYSVAGSLIGILEKLITLITLI